MTSEANSHASGDICFVCYADDRFGHKGGQFIANQEKLCKSAAKIGIVDIRKWNWDQLNATSFFQENATFLSKNRFENGAAWKPFIVLEALMSVPPGAFVVYYDSGPYEFKRPLTSLIKACAKNGGFFFHQWGDTNAKWSRRDAFVLMNSDSHEIHNAIHIQNTWFIVQNVPATIDFMREWLAFNLDERIASYTKSNECGLENLKGFTENRGDQTIASILIAKHNIRTFKGWGGCIDRDINAFIQSMNFRSRCFFRITSIIKRARNKIARMIGRNNISGTL